MIDGCPRVPLLSWGDQPLVPLQVQPLWSSVQNMACHFAHFELSKLKLNDKNVLYPGIEKFPKRCGLFRWMLETGDF